MIDVGDVRIYVDANIFIRVFEGSGELSGALTGLFLRGKGGSRPRLVTSEMTLAELAVAPFRDDDKLLLEVYQNWTNSNVFIEARPVERNVLWHAAMLRARYGHLKLPDAIHLSTALYAECREFLTEDKKLKEHYEMLGTGPGVPSRQIDIIRPELQIVNRLLPLA